jgi:uncharacterized protein YkwD
MKRILLLFSLGLAALFISLTSFTPAPENNLGDDVLSYTNKFRKSKGLSALVMNEDLNAIAEGHSINMAKGRVGFGHGGFNKRYALAKTKISNFSGFAENVAYGVNSGKEVVDFWKTSSGHRQNMLGKFRYIGIGTAKDRKGTIYYTQVFAN